MPMPNIQGINPQAPVPAAPALTPDLDAANAGQSIDMQGLVDGLDPTQWEQLKAALQAMPPEQQQEYLMKFAAQHGALGKQAQGRMDRADSLRMRQPEGTQTRNAYVAASPVEHLATMASNIKQGKAYDKGQADLTTATEGSQSQLVQALRQKLGMF